MEKFDEVSMTPAAVSGTFHEIWGSLKSRASIIFALFQQTPPGKLLNISSHVLSLFGAR